ncbi:MAG: hypothetical protein LBE32_05615 [Burkholderiales bacterium]|jgi:hypothetical protein|nr:hypothetical protein [Burkholderiales bacterium]
MRTDIAPPIAAAVEKPHTAPGYLLQIDFPVPLRCSTRGNVMYGGHVWVAMSVKIEGITFNVAGAQKGALTFFDADSAIAGLLQNHGIADRKVTIHYFDADAIDHPVCVFTGTGNKVSGSKGNIVVAFANMTGRTSMLPRRFIAPEFGFNHIVPDGAIDKIGTTTHIWQVRR